ncbi:MAG: cupin domain-containing protein [Candidatus Eisenbacteria bacterium]
MFRRFEIALSLGGALAALICGSLPVAYAHPDAAPVAAVAASAGTAASASPAAAASASPAAAASASPAAATPRPGLSLENLLRAELEGVEGTEVIVSRVTLPPNSSLPKHWHPGEEFAYVLEGSCILWQDGKEDIVTRAGDVAKVPLQQVHTAITTDEGAVVLVFRVHEKGQPERVLID